MTPEEVGKSFPEILKNPHFKQGIEDQIKNNLYPVSIHEIEGLLRNNQKLVCEISAKAWPGIVDREELSIGRRREIIDRELRAICFSDPNRMKANDEVLLWSHYAKKHEGIRIGFEFPSGTHLPFQIFEIKYNEKRVKVIFSLDSSADTLNALADSAIVKSSVWNYEKECRLFTKIGLCIPEKIVNGTVATVEHFLEINRDWVKSVDFGVFCPKTEIQNIVALLKSDYPNAVARQAEFHKTDYSLVYNPII